MLRAHSALLTITIIIMIIIVKTEVTYSKTDLLVCSSVSLTNVHSCATSTATGYRTIPLLPLTHHIPMYSFTPWKPLVYFCPYSSVISKMPHKWNHMEYSFLSLVSLTWSNAFEIHLCSWVYKLLKPFNIAIQYLVSIDCYYSYCLHNKVQISSNHTQKYSPFDSIFMSRYSTYLFH